MKIKELIAILASHPNPEAEVNFIGNVINDEDGDHDFACDIEVFHTDDFYTDFVEIYVKPKVALDNIISMPIPVSDRGNFMSTDKQVAINSYGEVFQIGTTVGNEGAEDETAEIESFEFDEESNEVLANTNLGVAHIDFLFNI